jgi:hypothetical protein
MVAHGVCVVPDLPEWVVACRFDLDLIRRSGSSSRPFGPDDNERYPDGTPRDDGGELVHRR